MNTSVRLKASRQDQIDGIERLNSRESLLSFIEFAWSILEPGRTFIPGWHLEAICDHLIGVTEGHIKRLLINVPPGCMKSLTTNVFWPAWEWGPRNMPWNRFVGASYSSDLTIRDNLRARRLIQSPWYQRLWGHQFRMTSDQNAKTKFENDQGGFKFATSVGGVGTGERGDRVVVDDPHNVREGESEAKRLEALLWFTETLPTRLTSPIESAIVTIMQRVHEQDVSGLILERDLGYVHLMLPMEFEPDRKCYTVLGFEDPRTEENELLWPQQMPRQVVERDKKVMGSYAVAGQFQQRPAPRGGGMFKEEWFQLVNPEEVPLVGLICRGWDLAASEERDSAWTAGCLMKKAKNGDLYILDMKRFRGSPALVEKTIKETAAKDPRDHIISIPQDPGQSGKAQKVSYAKLLIGYNCRFSPESGSKEDRANPLAAQAEAGNVYMVRGAWNRDFIDEATTFPRGKYKDQVDAASRAFAQLIFGGRRRLGIAAPRSYDLPGGPNG